MSKASLGFTLLVLTSATLVFSVAIWQFLPGSRISSTELKSLLTGMSDVPPILQITVSGRGRSIVFKDFVAMKELRDVLANGPKTVDLNYGGTFEFEIQFANGAWFEGSLYVAKDLRGLIIGAMASPDAWDPELFSYSVDLHHLELQNILKRLRDLDAKY